ncbi:MAG: Gfo/Idh/MocA family oxidoreductase [Clostridia bacterium]|nr:Gfo/Idh/MocA family oxidoreductase [Clostridia bacterium]
MSEEIVNAFKEKHDEVVIDASKKLKVGIIGTGWIAEAHVQQYKKMPDVELVAMADLIEGKAEAFCKKFEVEGARCYRSHTELLANEKLDAVSVCTYNSTHAECTIDALKAGVHVLLEKPMCVTLEEAIAIRKAEKESGKIVSVGFQPRFNENMKMVKKIVQSGVLGKIYYIQTGGGRRRGIPVPYGTTFIEKDKGAIGALGDIGCYSLDMVLNAMGYPKPLSVSGYTSDFFGKSKEYWKGVERPEEYADIFSVDDFAAAFVRLEGDVILDFRIGWAMNLDTSGDTIIYGTNASLRIPSTECWNGGIGGNLKLYQTVAGEEVCTEFAQKKSSFADDFYNKARSFLDAVKYGGTSPVPTSEIIYNQAILDGINKSAKLGKEITLDIPEI